MLTLDAPASKKKRKQAATVPRRRLAGLDVSHVAFSASEPHTSGLQASMEVETPVSVRKAKKKKGVKTTTQSLVSENIVKSDIWKSAFPYSWQPLFLADECGYGLCRPEWEPHMRYEVFDAPEHHLMSKKLWPAITQLLTVIYELEKKNRKTPLEARDFQSIRREWKESLSGFGLSHELEVDVMLRLCKTAMADDSPLTDTQKHYLMMFIARRSQAIDLKTSLFALLDSLPVSQPVIPPVTLSPVVGQTVERRGRDAFGKKVWKRIENSFTSEGEVPPAPPKKSGVPLLAWQFAATFHRIWHPDSTCDLATEFNVGKDDQMNSEYFVTYLHMMLGYGSPLTPDEQKKLMLLMDYSLSAKGVQLVIGGVPVDWRYWLQQFESGVHSLPDQPGSILPRTMMQPPRPVSTQARERLNSIRTDYGSSSDDNSDSNSDPRPMNPPTPGSTYGLLPLDASGRIRLPTRRTSVYDSDAVLWNIYNEPPLTPVTPKSPGSGRHGIGKGRKLPPRTEPIQQPESLTCEDVFGSDVPSGSDDED